MFHCAINDSTWWFPTTDPAFYCLLHMRLSLHHSWTQSDGARSRRQNHHLDWPQHISIYTASDSSSKRATAALPHTAASYPGRWRGAAVCRIPWWWWAALAGGAIQHHARHNTLEIVRLQMWRGGTYRVGGSAVRRSDRRQKTAADSVSEIWFILVMRNENPRANIDLHILVTYTHDCRDAW